MNAISKFAVGVLILGAVLLAGPTFGFSSLAADRGLHVGTAADQSNALLGLEPIEDSIDGRQDTANALRIHNNFGTDGESINVTAEATLDTGDVQIVETEWNDGTFDGSVDDDETITLECTSGGTEGTALLTVDIIEATSGAVTVNGASETAAIPYQCTGGGSNPGGFDTATASDVVVTSDGTTQTFSFTPEGAVSNKESVEISIYSVGIDYGDATIAGVDGVHQNAEVTFDGGSNGGTITVPSHGRMNGEVTITLEGAQPNGGFLGIEFGFAEFSRSDSNGTETVWFGVTEESATANSLATASTREAPSGSDEPILVERSALEDVPYEEFDGIDDEADLVATIEAADGVELVDDR